MELNRGGPRYTTDSVGHVVAALFADDAYRRFCNLN
jgi:hypothetical protein